MGDPKFVPFRPPSAQDMGFVYIISAFNVHRQVLVGGVVGEMIANSHQSPAVSLQTGVVPVFHVCPIVAQRRLQRHNRTVIIDDRYRELGRDNSNPRRSGSLRLQQHRLFRLRSGVRGNRHRHIRRTRRIARRNSQSNRASQRRIITISAKGGVVRQI